MIDDVEARLALLPVDARNVHAIAKVFPLLQVARDVPDLFPRDGHRDLPDEFLGRDNRVRNRRPDRLDPRMGGGVGGFDLLGRLLLRLRGGWSGSSLW